MTDDNQKSSEEKSTQKENSNRIQFILFELDEDDSEADEDANEGKINHAKQNLKEEEQEYKIIFIL